MIRVATEADAPFIENIIGCDPMPAMARSTTLLTEFGGFFLDPLTPSVMEAHMFFAAQGRGKHAIHAAHDALRWIFGHGVLVVIGRIPTSDRKARLFTRIIGFRSVGIRPEDDEMVEWFEMRSDECPQQ